MNVRSTSKKNKWKEASSHDALFLF